MSLILKSDDLSGKIMNRVGMIALDRGHWEEAVDIACKAQAQHMGERTLQWLRDSKGVPLKQVIMAFPIWLKQEGIEL